MPHAREHHERGSSPEFYEPRRSRLEYAASSRDEHYLASTEDPAILPVEIVIGGMASRRIR
jgi:hypothetical protein